MKKLFPFSKLYQSIGKGAWNENSRRWSICDICSTIQFQLPSLSLLWESDASRLITGRRCGGPLVQARPLVSISARCHFAIRGQRFPLGRLWGIRHSSAAASFVPSALALRIRYAPLRDLHHSAPNSTLRGEWVEFISRLSAWCTSIES